MRKSFEEALGDLLGEYKDCTLDELISALEIQMMALREQEADE